MQIEVCVPNAAARAAVEAVLAEDIDGAFTVSHAAIAQGQHAAVVCPGHSYATHITTGAEGLLTTHLSAYTPYERVHERVQAAVDELWAGQLPVGAAVVVRTSHPRHTLLVYAPVARVHDADPPTPHDPTLEAYLSFRAALVAARRAGVTAISTGLMCAGGRGAMDPARARTVAAQMLAAYRSVTSTPRPADLLAATQHHRGLLALA